MKKVDLKKARTFGEFCRMIREREELSLREMADYLEISHVTIQKIEQNGTHRPIEYLKKLKPFFKSGDLVALRELNDDLFLEEMERTV